MSKTVTALNTVSGQVGQVPESYLTHPVLGKTLVQVEPGTKSYIPGMYDQYTTDERKERRTRRPKAVEVEASADEEATSDSEIE